MTLYIAGPMKNFPLLNFPAFREATRRLREAGYTVVSPVEIDEAAGILETTDPDSLGICDCAKMLIRDLQAMLDADIDGVAMLPMSTGSRGVRVEMAFADFIQVPVRPVEAWLRAAEFMAEDLCRRGD